MAQISTLTGNTAAPGPTSEPVSTSTTIAFGTRAVDNLGGVWVFCQATGSIFGQQPVQIQPGSWSVAALGTTGRGPVGVSGGFFTSDQACWIQVYGRALCQLGMSGVSPSDAANGPTTVNTSLMTVFVLGTSLTSPNGVGWTSDPTNGVASSGLVYVIEGMYVADDVSLGDVSGAMTFQGTSAVTSATSFVGNHCAVFLNFPWIRKSEAQS